VLLDTKFRTLECFQKEHERRAKEAAAGAPVGAVVAVAAGAVVGSQ
jgi:hypothetical protein